MKQVDLISRSALIKYLQDPLGYGKYCEDCPEIDCMDCIIDGVIKEAPAVDAVEVVHGQLKETGWDEAWCLWGECTNCGCSNIIGSNYCNYCGAKMDGERKDNGQGI